MSNLSPSHSPRVTSPGIHDLLPHALLDLTVHLFFISSGFSNLSSQLKPHYNLPGARDLLTSVPLQIDISRPFGSSRFRCFNIPSPVFLLISRFADTCSSEYDGSDSLRLFRVRKFQTYVRSILPERFHPKLMDFFHVSSQMMDGPK
jgi:hypothetical protein